MRSNSITFPPPTYLSPQGNSTSPGPETFRTRSTDDDASVYSFAIYTTDLQPNLIQWFDAERECKWKLTFNPQVASNFHGLIIDNKRKVVLNNPSLLDLPRVYADIPKLHEIPGVNFRVSFKNTLVELAGKVRTVGPRSP